MPLFSGNCCRYGSCSCCRCGSCRSCDSYSCCRCGIGPVVDVVFVVVVVVLVVAVVVVDDDVTHDICPIHPLDSHSFSFFLSRPT